MRILFGFILCFVLVSNTYCIEISSVKGGGLWSNPATWVGGKVPTIEDNVIIDGKITVDKDYSCNQVVIPENKYLVIGNNAGSIFNCTKLIINGMLIVNEKSEITVKTTIEKGDKATINNFGVINLLSNE